MAGQDLTGKTFGRLTVVGIDPAFLKRTLWLCVCVCGRRRSCGSYDLRSSRSKACYKCARVGMVKSAAARAAAQSPKLTDIDKLEALLDGEGRRRYDHWQASCARLSVSVPKSERIDVLRELVSRRAA